ncbi:hypothetical protein HK103_006804 [Boothiomyces macroporosus]|uniref:Rieske domain-containing protein n=1 Tax=Boothiomyces macroporosus TaxID=261099 RepID=A0AAD5UH78_9FUNG|nr:hypothetical protein HK103_006804 [Boothiomyces macroporosus]
MESTCPHSGGPLYKGPVEIQDIEDTVGCKKELHLICPWHAYRFSVETGKSVDDDIFETAVFGVVLEDDKVYLDYEFTEKLEIKFISVPNYKRDTKLETHDEQVSDLTDKFASVDVSGKTLVECAVQILNTPDPTEKVELTKLVASKWEAGELKVGNAIPVPDRPARHAELQIVDRWKTKKIGKGGSVQSRIAILHALANVEQWAIDLAWDIIARFCNNTFNDEKLPDDFCTDFVQVAKEEATHFTFLVERIKDLGSYYGALPVHDGLWDSATLTSANLLDRLAIVHMVHEARGLDVNPSTIAKFKKANDHESVVKLEKIHNDEVGHVYRGQKWFTFICGKTGIDRYEKFHHIVKNLFFGPLRPPFNAEDRLKAGLDAKFYEPMAEY